MTGKTPRPRSGLYLLATERPLARRSIAAAAALLGAGSLTGCVRRRETRAATVEQVSADSSEGIAWVAHFSVGQDFDSSNLVVQEELDKVVLLLEITTSRGLQEASTAQAVHKTHSFELANPRGRRPFVDAQGKQIPTE